MHSRLYQEPCGSSFLGYIDFFVLAALLLVALGSSPAMDYLVPKVPGHARGTGARVSWYVGSGQWRADAHTLASFVRYFTEEEPATQIRQRPNPCGG